MLLFLLLSYILIFIYNTERLSVALIHTLFAQKARKKINAPQQVRPLYRNFESSSTLISSLNDTWSNSVCKLYILKQC